MNESLYWGSIIMTVSFCLIKISYCRKNYNNSNKLSDIIEKYTVVNDEEIFELV